MSANTSIAQFVARRPLVLVAAIFIIGVAAHGVMPVRPLTMLFVAGVCTLAAAAWVRDESRCSAALAAGILFSAVAAAQVAHQFFPQDHIAAFASDEPNLAWVELRIESPPRLLSTPADARPLPPRQICIASAVRVRTTSGWQSARGEVMFRANEPHPRLALGQIVRVVGMLQRPPPAMNPGEHVAFLLLLRKRGCDKGLC